MPIEIRGKQYFTVAERVALIHADFPDAVGIETSIVHTDTSLDYDQLAVRIEKAGVSKPEVKAILASVKRQEVIVRATVTIRTPKCEVKFSDHAHEREDIVNKRSVNHTSFIENACTSAIGRALAASGRSGSEYASADELAAALEEAESNLLTAIREQRERLKVADGTEAALKAQVSHLRAEVTTLKQKSKQMAAPQNPVLVKATRQFSALAKVGNQEQRRTKLMEVCESLVGNVLDSILDLITPNREQLTGDEAMRLLLVCYLCSG